MFTLLFIQRKGRGKEGRKLALREKILGQGSTSTSKYGFKKEGLTEGEDYHGFEERLNADMNPTGYYPG